MTLELPGGDDTGDAGVAIDPEPCRFERLAFAP